MPKLTKTQSAILVSAAQREDGSALPLPDALKLKGAAVTRTLEALRKKGLLEEKPASREAAQWRENKDGARMMLVITETGRATIHTETAASKSGRKRSASRAVRRDVSKRRARRTTKVDAILALLRQPDGAGIAQMQKSTGWQPHSVRAALTGLRKRGIQMERGKDANGDTVYRAPKA